MYKTYDFALVNTATEYKLILNNVEVKKEFIKPKDNFDSGAYMIAFLNSVLKENEKVINIDIQKGSPTVIGDNFYKMFCISETLLKDELV